MCNMPEHVAAVLGAWRSIRALLNRLRASWRQSSLVASSLKALIRCAAPRRIFLHGVPPEKIQREREPKTRRACAVCLCAGPPLSAHNHSDSYRPGLLHSRQYEADGALAGTPLRTLDSQKTRSTIAGAGEHLSSTPKHTHLGKKANVAERNDQDACNLLCACT